jgi:DNA-binding NarL/FixJ family response regulator
MGIMVSDTNYGKKAGVRKARIFVADDHPIVRDWLGQMINAQEDMILCGQAESAAETLERIVTVVPDMVIVDVSMPGVRGTDLIKEIKARHPHLPLLVLSMHDESLYAQRCLHAGASGYITKHAPIEEIHAAIHDVLQGRLYVSSKIAAQLLRKAIGKETHHKVAGIDDLSDRELEVFRRLGQGFSLPQIAEDLCLSLKTVETYCFRIKLKFQLSEMVELRRHAIEWYHADTNNRGVL